MKKILLTQRSDTPHWVGDGFPVRSIFSYRDIGKIIPPFLLMDYLGPAEFTPSKSKNRKGVGEHPHRGFETVTIIFSGEVEHRDSSGGGGVIRSGDVQWKAGSGIVHEEFHGNEISEKGGLFHGVQIWVNLPRKYKMTKPKYQGIKKDIIPVALLPQNAGELRVIAGEYQDHKGPASTFTNINLWDLTLKEGIPVILKVPKDHTAAIFIATGNVEINGLENLGSAQIAVLERENETFTLKANVDARILFLGGEVIDEPIVGYGPFVMNTNAEIAEAMIDFENGKMGILDKLEGSE